jgi:hypothetical protein
LVLLDDLAGADKDPVPLVVEVRPFVDEVTPIVDSEPLAIVSREPVLQSGLGIFYTRPYKAVFIFVLFHRNALD